MPNLNFTGRLTRVFVGNSNVQVRIDADQENRYFKLETNHPLHQQIYTLLVTAFMEQINIRLRMEDYPEGGNPSTQIQYVVLDQVHLPT